MTANQTINQAILEDVDDEFWGNHPDLSRRALTGNTNNDDLRAEWWNIYRRHNNCSAGGGQMTVSGNGNLVCVAPRPGFVKDQCYWVNTSEKITTLEWGQSATIHIRTENIPDDTEVSIQIMDKDQVSWDDKIGPIHNLRVENNEINEEIHFKSEWYDEELDNKNEVYFKATVTVNGETIEAELPVKSEDYLLVKMTRIVLEVQRMREWPKNRFASDPNAKEGGTISTFKLSLNGEVKQKGNILECAGPSTWIENTDQRVKPGSFYVIENSGNRGPFRLVQLTQTNARAAFGTRSLVNIHPGNDPDEVKGCLMPGDNWEICNKGTINEYPRILAPSVTKCNQIAQFINDHSETEIRTTYDCRRSVNDDDEVPLNAPIIPYNNSNLYSSVRVIIRSMLNMRGTLPDP